MREKGVESEKELRVREKQTVRYKNKRMKKSERGLFILIGG